MAFCCLDKTLPDPGNNSKVLPEWSGAFLIPLFKAVLGRLGKGGGSHECWGAESDVLASFGRENGRVLVVGGLGLGLGAGIEGGVEKAGRLVERHHC